MDYQTLVTFENFFNKMKTPEILENELLELIDYIYRVDDDLKQNYMKHAELQFFLGIPRTVGKLIVAIVYKCAEMNSKEDYNTGKLVEQTIGYKTLVRNHLLAANIGERESTPFALTCAVIDFLDKHSSFLGKNFLQSHEQCEIHDYILKYKFYQFIRRYHNDCVLKSLELSSALSPSMRKLCFQLKKHN